MSTITEDIYQRASAELIVAWSAGYPSMPVLETWHGLCPKGSPRLFFRMEGTSYKVGIEPNGAALVASGDADLSVLLEHYMRGWENWMIAHMHEPTERRLKA